MRQQTEIFVFKTNLHNEEVIDALRPMLDEHPHIIRWNVDRHDIDNILRVEAQNLSAHHVISLVQEAGFACEELPD